METCNQPRSYIVDTGNGIYRRNRGDILKTRERNGYMAPDDDSTPLSSAPPAPNDFILVLQMYSSYGGNKIHSFNSNIRDNQGTCNCTVQY